MVISHSCSSKPERNYPESDGAYRHMRAGGSFYRCVVWQYCKKPNSTLELSPTQILDLIGGYWRNILNIDIYVYIAYLSIYIYIYQYIYIYNYICISVYIYININIYISMYIYIYLYLYIYIYIYIAYLSIYTYQLVWAKGVPVTCAKPWFEASLNGVLAVSGLTFGVCFQQRLGSRLLPSGEPTKNYGKP